MSFAAHVCRLVSQTASRERGEHTQVDVRASIAVGLLDYTAPLCILPLLAYDRTTMSTGIPYPAKIALDNSFYLF
jgi:hypothetical protein